MQCDMCGSVSEQLFLTSVEGTELKVCKSCSSFGKVRKAILPAVSVKAVERKIVKVSEPELVEIIVDDYPQRIKNAREKLGLKQEELAKKINERLSLLHQLETGHIEPSVEVAKKLERFLHITLLIEVEDKRQAVKMADDGQVTIGDMITIKKRG